MDTPTACIALRTVKYSDSASILTLWTERLGRVAVSVSATASRESARRRALMMPLGVFEAVVHHRPGREVARLSDVRALPGYMSLSLSPVRGVVAMFLSEVLGACLREGLPDDALSAYLFGSVRELGEASGRRLANFHLVFLRRLAALLGIEPDESTYAPGRYLDMSEGIYAPSMPRRGLCVEPSQARVAHAIGRLRTDQAGLLPLSREGRAAALDGILQYYTLHHASLRSLQSLPILRNVMA